MALGRTEFRSVPKGVREWGKFFANVTVTPDAATVGSTEIDTSAVTSDKIADSNVTLAKLQDITADRILGRLSTSGAPQELTAAQVAGFLQGVAWAFSQSVQFDGTVGFYGSTPVTQPAHIVNASEAHNINATFSDTEVEAALDALGAKINAVIAILETLGLKASV